MNFDFFKLITFQNTIVSVVKIYIIEPKLKKGDRKKVLNCYCYIFLLSASFQINFQFHYKTDQGIKNFTRQEADEWAMKDPDYAIRDLYNAIAKGKYPSYTM